MTQTLSYLSTWNHFATLNLKKQIQHQNEKKDITDNTNSVVLPVYKVLHVPQDRQQDVSRRLEDTNTLPHLFTDAGRF